MAPRRTVPHLLLLVLVVTGIVDMHTFGHPSGDDHAAAVLTALPRLGLAPPDHPPLGLHLAYLSVQRK